MYLPTGQRYVTMKNLADIKLYLFDLDGTIYHDGVLIGEAKNTLQTLRKGGGKIVYLTNNSSTTKKAYLEKLQKVGILEEEDVVYSSLDCAVDFLQKNRKNQKIYAVATGQVCDELKNRSISLVDDEHYLEADILLLTFDKELSYKKLIIANELIVLGKEYISTHPDFVCPTRGISIPDAGSFIELFKASSGRAPDLILGKPYTYMADFLIDTLGVTRAQTAMVGDRLYTDIQFGINAGLTTVLVLSGETTKEMYENSGVTVDCILSDVNELVKYL